MERDKDVIDVWPEGVPDAELWANAGPELETFWHEDSRMVRNVSVPTLTAFLPDPAFATGAAVIICPGGAFHFLMVDKEGTDVACWLSARGVAAFVLKYRVLPTPTDEEAFRPIVQNPTPFRPDMDRVRPMVIADGLQAIRRVRQDALRWTIDPERIGILGFSAGGYVAAGAANRYQNSLDRPSFAGVIYSEWHERWIPADAPPLFVVAASNDPLIDIRASLTLYESWYLAGRPAELHIYGAGGHGFAINSQNLPSDGWIDRFWEWMTAEGFTATVTTTDTEEPNNQ